MVLRLVTGKYKGKVLGSTETARELRPTQAIVREAIINTLNSYFLEIDKEDAFEAIDMLDLFSGTGSTGFEFLSNDVHSVTFVEKDPKCLKLLRENAQAMQKQAQVHIISGQLPGVLKSIPKKNPVKSFDLVFCDPPFKISVENYSQQIDVILAQKLLKQEGLLVLEYKNDHMAKALEDKYSGDLSIIKTKKYGDCIVVFAKKD